MNTVKKAPVKKLSKQGNKGLQKFTDFEVIKTKDAMLKLWQEEPEEYKKLGGWIVDKLNEGVREENPEEGIVDKFYNRLELYYSIHRLDVVEDTRRARWQLNRNLIENALHEAITKKNRLPTQCEIALKTGLSRVSVAKHLKEGFKSDGYTEEMEAYKIMTPKVLNAMYKLALEQNNLKAMKSFLDYFKDNSSGLTKINQQTNYLQINNTRIDEITVKELPEAARLQIENIIKQYQTII